MKVRYRGIALVTLALSPLLGACAAQKQDVVQTQVACLRDVYDSGAAAPIRPRQPFDISEVSREQLGDSLLITPSEIVVLSDVHSRFQACQHQFFEQLQTVAPTVAPIFARAYRDADDDTLALMQRRMAWGEYTRRRRDRALTNQQMLVAEVQRLAAANQARAQAFNQPLASDAIINTASEPRVDVPVSISSAAAHLLPAVGAL